MYKNGKDSKGKEVEFYSVKGKQKETKRCRKMTAIRASAFLLTNKT